MVRNHLVESHSSAARQPQPREGRSLLPTELRLSYFCTLDGEQVPLTSSRWTLSSTFQQGCPEGAVAHAATVCWLGMACILKAARFIAVLSNKPMDQRSDPWEERPSSWKGCLWGWRMISKPPALIWQPRRDGPPSPFAGRAQGCAAGQVPCVRTRFQDPQLRFLSFRLAFSRAPLCLRTLSPWLRKKRVPPERTRAQLGFLTGCSPLFVKQRKSGAWFVSFLKTVFFCKMTFLHGTYFIYFSILLWKTSNTHKSGKTIHN